MFIKMTNIKVSGSYAQAGNKYSVPLLLSSAKIRYIIEAAKYYHNNFPMAASMPFMSSFLSTSSLALLMTYTDGISVMLYVSTRGE